MIIAIVYNILSYLQYESEFMQVIKSYIILLVV